jgi:hypothetical protein
MNQIPSRVTFEKATNGTKLNLLFDISVETRNDVKALKKRKKFDTGVSAVGGVFGGFMAAVAALKLRFFS